jgi:hypothetical protein
MAETHEAEKAGFTTSSSTCKRYFGYLSQRGRGEEMPDDCLTCQKMIDCMFTKPNAAPVTTEKKPESEVPETAEEEIFAAEEEPVTAETVGEVDESDVVKELKVIHPQAEEEEEERPTYRWGTFKPAKPEMPTVKAVPLTADNDYVVETPGHVYNEWCGTVLISKKTLAEFGKKIKEVEVLTNKGIRAKCRVFAIPDIGPRTIQIPDKLKADLEVRDGDHVTVTPK